MYSVKMADSTRKRTQVPSSRVRRVSKLNVAYYWTGAEWRETPVLNGFEWTRQYFLHFDGGRAMRFGIHGCPPVDAPTTKELRAIGL